MIILTTCLLKYPPRSCMKDLKCNCTQSSQIFQKSRSHYYDPGTWYGTSSILMIHKYWALPKTNFEAVATQFLSFIHPYLHVVLSSLLKWSKKWPWRTGRSIPDKTGEHCFKNLFGSSYMLHITTKRKTSALDGNHSSFSQTYSKSTVWFSYHNLTSFMQVCLESKSFYVYLASASSIPTAYKANESKMQILKFLNLWSCEFHSFVIWRFIARQSDPKISRKYIVFSFKYWNGTALSRNSRIWLCNNLTSSFSGTEIIKYPVSLQLVTNMK